MLNIKIKLVYQKYVGELFLALMIFKLKFIAVSLLASFLGIQSWGGEKKWNWSYTSIKNESKLNIYWADLLQPFL